MKQLFLEIQSNLAEISELKYIDRDWGQLQYEQPPVKWPCALIDVTNVDFTQMGTGAQKAEATLCVTIANINLVPSSVNAPSRHNSYDTIEIVEAVHQKLQLFSGDGTFQPLMRTNLMKAAAGGNYEVYQMTYKTAFIVEKDTTGTTGVTVDPTITVDAGDTEDSEDSD